jgi:hypothetical protein
MDHALYVEEFRDGSPIKARCECDWSATYEESVLTSNLIDVISADHIKNGEL